MNEMQQTELAQLIDKFSTAEGVQPTAVPGMNVIKLSGVDMRLPNVYTPSLCVIVQGKKQVMVNDELYRYRPSEYLVVSVDMPVIGQVTKASRKEPYLCLQIDIDPRALAALITETGFTPDAATETARGIFVGTMNDDLGDSVLRLARLMEKPDDIAMLSPMILREIHYRLLRDTHGQRMAQLVIQGSNMHRINTVIQTIKANFEKPFGVDDMADLAGMSVSSFHFHFKEVTAMSPLQYQKRLRLMEARRMMLTDSLDATRAAYSVGYESPSQFSREYARLFNQPPLRDITALRMAQGA